MVTKGIIFAALLASSYTATAGPVYNAVDDFITSGNNSSSIWQYRWSASTTRDNTYGYLANYDSPETFWNPGNPYWNNGAPSLEEGAIGVNRSGGVLDWVGTPHSFEWPDQTIWMHPGETGLVAVSWVAQYTGVVDISFRFFDMDGHVGATDGISWFVDNTLGTAELSSGVLSNGGDTGTVFLSDVLVTAGDYINFVVSPGADHGFDSTGFEAEINYVSLPSSAILTLVGVATLLIKRKKK